MTDQDSRFRVAYVLLRPPSYSETFIGSEIQAVRDTGAAVEVFVAREGGGRLADGARVLRTLVRHPVRLLRHVRVLGFSYLPRALLAGTYAIALSRDVARFRPHLVHTHFVNLPAAVAVLVGREAGAPVTAIAHAADFLLDRDTAALNRRLGRLSHLFVVSADAIRQLRDRGVTVPARHSVVRAAYDGDVSERPARRPEGPARLVTVARLIEKKGIGATLDAVARLAAEGLDVRYDVYGDGPLREALTARAEALGIGGAVTFHGAVPHKVATAALLDADLAVLACQRAADGDLDGIPVFLMEAASRGVPVVTTAVSGIRELVGDEGAWLAPPDDPPALATAISAALAADPAETRRRTRAAADRLRTEFAPALQAERLLATWRPLAGLAPATEARSTWD